MLIGVAAAGARRVGEAPIRLRCADGGGGRSACCGVRRRPPACGGDDGADTAEPTAPSWPARAVTATVDVAGTGRLRAAGARADDDAAPHVRHRQQLLQRQLGHRAGVHRRARRARADLQRPVVLVVPLQATAAGSRPPPPTTRCGACCSGSACWAPTARWCPIPTLGDQLQDRAIHGLGPEGAIRIRDHRAPGRLADGTAFTRWPRPPTSSSGADGTPLGAVLHLAARRPARVRRRAARRRCRPRTIEAAPTRTTRTTTASRAGPTTSPTRAPASGCSGRFGWKAAVPSVRAQNAGAFAGDIGITSSVAPSQPCTPAQTACLAEPERRRPRGRRPQARPGHLLHPDPGGAGPARRRPPTATRDGQRTFEELGCASCHTAELRTGRATSPALSEPADPALHGPAGPRHGPGPGRRPTRRRGHRPRVAHRRRCGASASSRPSTATPASCTTAAPAACSRPSSGTAARPRPPATASRSLSADERADLLAFLESL